MMQYQKDRHLEHMRSELAKMREWSDSCRLNRMKLATLGDFRAVNGDMFRGVDADAHLVAINRHHDDAHIVADVDDFANAAG